VFPRGGVGVKKARGAGSLKKNRNTAASSLSKLGGFGDKETTENDFPAI